MVGYLIDKISQQKFWATIFLGQFLILKIHTKFFKNKCTYVGHKISS
jgi:hypothetical protein